MRLSLDIYVINMVGNMSTCMELYAYQLVCVLCPMLAIIGSMSSLDVLMLLVFIYLFVGAIAISVMPLLADYISH